MARAFVPTFVALLLTLGCENHSQSRPVGSASISGAPSVTSSSAPSASSSALASASGAIVGTPLPIEESCRDFAEKVCQKEEACEVVALVHGDLGRCIRVETRVCEATLAPPSSAPRSDIGRFAQCRDARTASCEALLGDPPSACRVPGTIQDGAPCAENAQCTGGFCDRGADARCGACRHLAELQQACTDGRVCGWGLVCKDGQCQKRGSLEDACGPTLPCEAPLLCLKSACVAPGKKGDRCGDAKSIGCDASTGLVCSPTAHVCAPLKLAALGESCGKDLPCAGGSHCGASKKCERTIRDGDPCTPGSPHCEEPSLCVAGVCQLLDPERCK